MPPFTKNNLIRVTWIVFIQWYRIRLYYLQINELSELRANGSFLRVDMEAAKESYSFTMVWKHPSHQHEEELHSSVKTHFTTRRFLLFPSFLRNDNRRIENDGTRRFQCFIRTCKLRYNTQFILTGFEDSRYQYQQVRRFVQHNIAGSQFCDSLGSRANIWCGSEGVSVFKCKKEM